MFKSNPNQIDIIPSSDKFSLFLDNLKPTIGFLGGRYYRIGGAKSDFHFNDLVQKFQSLSKKEQILNSTMESILFKLKKLDKDGTKLLNGKNRFYLILTRIKQLIGQFFFNPDRVLNQLNHVIKEDLVKQYVTRFLHPYVTGSITWRNEDKNRKPMMLTLLESLKSDYYLSDHDDKKIEEFALNAYFEYAAAGLYIFLPLFKPLTLDETIITNNYEEGGSTEYSVLSDEFEDLIDALKESLPFDFPEKILNEKEIRYLASDALDRINIQREEFYDAADEDSELGSESHVNYKYLNDILNKLKASGKLFIEK